MSPATIMAVEVGPVNIDARKKQARRRLSDLLPPIGASPTKKSAIAASALGWGGDDTKGSSLVPAWDEFDTDDASSSSSSCGSAAHGADSSTLFCATSAREYERRQAMQLFDVYESAQAVDAHGKLGISSHVAKRGASFRSVLVRQCPHIPLHRIDALCEYVQQCKNAGQKRALEWSSEERELLRELFRVVDADGSNAISLEEYLALAQNGPLRRRELKAIWRDFIDAAEPDDAELDLVGFESLLQSNEQLVRHIRIVLAAMGAASRQNGHEQLPGASRDKMLVFDDGKQQLWRLVPGGRVLVRKEVAPDGGERARPTLASLGPLVV